MNSWDQLIVWNLQLKKSCHLLHKQKMSILSNQFRLLLWRLLDLFLTHLFFLLRILLLFLHRPDALQATTQQWVWQAGSVLVNEQRVGKLVFHLAWPKHDLHLVLLVNHFQHSCVHSANHEPLDCLFIALVWHLPAKKFHQIFGVDVLALWLSFDLFPILVNKILLLDFFLFDVCDFEQVYSRILVIVSDNFTFMVFEEVLIFELFHVFSHGKNVNCRGVLTSF